MEGIISLTLIMIKRIRDWIGSRQMQVSGKRGMQEISRILISNTKARRGAVNQAEPDMSVCSVIILNLDIDVSVH